MQNIDFVVSGLKWQTEKINVNLLAYLLCFNFNQSAVYMCGNKSKSNEELRIKRNTAFLTPLYLPCPFLMCSLLTIYPFLFWVLLGVTSIILRKLLQNVLGVRIGLLTRVGKYIYSQARSTILTWKHIFKKYILWFQSS